MRRQQGLTMTGFITWAVVLVFVALFGFKVGPAYVEYYTIQKQLKVIASDPELRNAPRSSIERAFALRAAVEDMRSVQPTDLQISKDGDQLIITADYSVKIPLVGNMSACLDFRADSSR